MQTIRKPPNLVIIGRSAYRSHLPLAAAIGATLRLVGGALPRFLHPHFREVVAGGDGIPNASAGHVHDAIDGDGIVAELRTNLPFDGFVANGRA